MKLPSRKFSLDRGPVKKCFDQYVVNDLKVSFVLLPKKKNTPSLRVVLILLIQES